MTQCDGSGEKSRHPDESCKKHWITTTKSEKWKKTEVTAGLRLPSSIAGLGRRAARR